ncbi:MAG: Na(+)/H(+) antiporter subunit B [Alphaproteobacteria bacterium]|nr:Na(+)/H(+) antiporter subunit B [Alphaproteobacteria bacterium]
MIRKTVLRVVSKALIPFIALFAFYTQFHGDYGPGGGFQAGVILAAGVVLHGLIFGLAETRRVLPPRVVEVGAALGVLVYGGTGVLCVLLGGNFLDYDVLPEVLGMGGQHLGVFLVELGVGLTVSSVMVGILGAFSARGREL